MPNTNILICEDDQENAKYEWGYVNRSDNQVYYIPNSNCRYIELPYDYDTSKYEYFVVIQHGDIPCFTTTYYIKDVLLEIDPVESNTTFSMLIVPNPTCGPATLKFSHPVESGGVLQVFDMLGQCVFTFNVIDINLTEEIVIPTEKLRGNYLVVYRTNKGIATTKMTVQ